MSKIIPEEKAKQGRAGHHLLMILIGGLLLAAVAWGVAEIYGAVIAPPAIETSAS